MGIKITSITTGSTSITREKGGAAFALFKRRTGAFIVILHVKVDDELGTGVKHACDTPTHM
jgi:hypothetical protein